MFEECQVVKLRSLLWRVLSVEYLGAHYILKLEGYEDSNKGLVIKTVATENIEMPEIKDLNKLILGRNIQPVSSWKLFMDAMKLSFRQPMNVFTTIINSKIRIENYQFVPLVKILDLPTPRILIADDVGLGKTIEAGIILQELASRNLANKVLIVVPASLQIQWRDEMKDKFGLEFTIFDSDSIRKIYENLVTGENPWEKYNYVITSIDYVKRSDIRRQLMDVFWDVVIVDEAHYLSYVNKKTDRARFGEFIAERTNALLLLTATPHNGRDESFYSLIKLLNPHLHSYLLKDKKLIKKYFVRRLKREVFGDYVPPDIETVPVSNTSKVELEVYHALREYVNNIWDNAKKENNYAASFAMVILKKRMLSSYYALKKSLESRVETLNTYLENEEIWNLEGREKKIDSDKRNRYLEGTTLTEKQIENFEENILHATTAKTRDELMAEIESLSRILELLKFIDLEGEYINNGDSKAKKLLELLRELKISEGKEKAIVFTEYRDTQEFLVKFLENNGFKDKLVIMHGGMNKKDRKKVEEEFLKEDKWIMVATDAASEGLNFQKKCHIVINYELPWNPNRLLQRIGRVDRYGQKKKVLVKNLYLKDTYEGNILNLLIEKLKSIIESIGSTTDVLGMFEVDRIVNTIMEESEDAEHTLDAYFDDLRISLTKMGELYSIFKTSAQEGLSAVEDIVNYSNKYAEYLQNFVIDAVRKFCGDDAVIKIDEHAWKFKNLNPLGLDEELIATFDREYALDNEDVEFITLSHPLVNSILKRYRAMLYEPANANRISYITVPDEKNSVVFFFYAKYVDGNGRLASEEILPVRIGLDGEILKFNDSLLERDLRRDIPSTFIQNLSKELWTELFEKAQEVSDEIAQRKVQEISEEIEKKLDFNRKIVNEYYEQEIDKIKREINTERKKITRQAYLFEVGEEDEGEVDTEAVKRKIDRLQNKIYELEMSKKEVLESIDKMKEIRLAERGILSALIIWGGSGE